MRYFLISSVFLLSSVFCLSADPSRTLAVKVPALVEFESLLPAGKWNIQSEYWTITQKDFDGKDGSPLHALRLNAGRFILPGLEPDKKYTFKIQFNEDNDFIQVLTGEPLKVCSEFVLKHKASSKNFFSINGLNVGKPLVNPGKLLEPTKKDSQPPKGYKLVFEDDFSRDMAKWGSSLPACGQFRMERLRHWEDPGILEIPYLELSDFILETEAFQAGGQYGFGFIMRKDPNDDDAFCMFKINTKTPCAFAAKFSFENDNKIPVPVETGIKDGKIFQPGKWHTIRIEANGKKISAYIDGKKAAEYENELLKKGGTGIFIDPGTELYLRTFRIYAKDGSPYYCNQGKKDGAAPVKAIVSKPFPLVPMMNANDSVFTDAKGRRHGYRIEGDKLLYDGQLYYPLKDSDSQYFVRYEPGKWPDSAYDALREKDGHTINKIRKFGLTYQIVPTQISTHIDCTREDAGFSEDGGLGGISRIMNIDNVNYRVSSARKNNANYYLYSVLFPELKVPYVMVYQIPNDRYRITCICPLPPESGSAGVVSGGNFPVDHKSYNMMSLFYPMQEKYEFCIFHRKITQNWAPDGGAAVANIWFLLIEDSTENLLPIADEEKGLPMRFIGTLDQTPVFTRKLYGVKAAASDKLGIHQKAMASYIDYVKFSGCNMINYYFLGNDWALDGQLNYPSAIYNEILSGTAYGTFCKYDYVKQFLSIAESRNVFSYPKIATFTTSDIYREKLELPQESLIVNRNGDNCCLFNNRILDPLHPAVQKLFLDSVDELAGQTAPFQCVKGLNVELAPGGWFNGAENGYSKWDVEQFSKETGIAVPWPVKGTPYEWIRNNCWEKWIAWRCEKIKELYCRILAKIQSIRPDWKLQIKFNVNEYASFYKLPSDKQLQHLRELGLDPALYDNIDGIQFSFGYVYQEKFLTHDKEFSLERINLPFKNRTAVTDMVSYYELPGVLPKLSPRYVGWLATVNLTPVGRQVLEVPTLDLRRNDISSIDFMRWEKAVAQMEHLLRRFATAFRSLPAVIPKTFDGKIEVISGPPADHTLSVKWFGDRLMVLNDSPQARKIELKISCVLDAGDVLMELGWRHVLLKGPIAGGQVNLILELQPYDLQVLAIIKNKSEQ